MGSKPKRRPFLHAAAALAALFAALVVSAIGALYYFFAIPEPEGLSLASWPDTFTSGFSTWIGEEDGKIVVQDIGIERLDEYGLWVQIVDEAGKEAFSHNKPAGYPECYSAAELVSLAEGGYENGHTVFLGTADVGGRELSYVVGFPYAVGKSTLYYNAEHVARLSSFAKGAMLFSAIAVLLLALAYALWLSRKMSTVIGGIRDIAGGSYAPLRETGVFGEIHRSLNRMDADIRRSERMQQETDRTRREWIANITHDLKTPLSPVKGYAELLAEGDDLDPQTARDYGRIVLKNADHMEKLMDDLKLTYQLEAGALPCSPQETQMVRFVKELVIDIANDPAFSERTIEFESELPETTAAVDADLMRRAVGNLIVNALVHNPPGTKVVVAVGRTSGGSLFVSVRDDGNGMDEAELSGLWDRYYRGTSTKERPEGSGLGLAIAKQVVALHGGDISTRSSIGTGTEFTVTLPLGEGEN